MENHPISKLEFAEAKALAEAAAILQDLRFVVQATKKLSALLKTGEPDQVILRSLFTAALVAYVRCFSSGKRGVLTSEIFAPLPGEPIACHNQYKDTRDKHIAHSVNPFEEMMVGAVVSPPESGVREVEGVACLTATLVTYDVDGVEQLGGLASFAEKHVASVCKDLERKVLEVAKKMDIDKLYASVGLRFTAQGGPVAAATPRKS
jgi:hypothetical protein